MSASPEPPTLTGIYRATKAAGGMESLATADVIAGAGLAGDRYAEGRGTFSDREGNREITFVAEEALAAYAVANPAAEITIQGPDLRRNLLTRGVELMDLIGRKFRIGDAIFLGLRACPPCTHLARLLGTQAILKGFAHSGGIYAQVLQGGRIGVGEIIEVEEAP